MRSLCVRLIPTRRWTSIVYCWYQLVSQCPMNLSHIRKGDMPQSMHLLQTPPQIHEFHEKTPPPQKGVLSFLAGCAQGNVLTSSGSITSTASITPTPITPVHMHTYHALVKWWWWKSGEQRTRPARRRRRLRSTRSSRNTWSSRWRRSRIRRWISLPPGSVTGPIYGGIGIAIIVTAVIQAATSGYFQNYNSFT